MKRPWVGPKSGLKVMILYDLVKAHKMILPSKYQSITLDVSDNKISFGCDGSFTNMKIKGMTKDSGKTVFYHSPFISFGYK